MPKIYGHFGQWLLAGILLFLLVGCDNGGAPPTPPDGPVFSFEPADETLTIPSAGYLDFLVSSVPAVTFNVAWSLDGQPIAIGRSLRFFPPDLGPMTLEARASYEDKAADCTWNLIIVNSHGLDFEFHPGESHLDLVQGQDQVFEVTHQFPFAREFAWIHQGVTVGTDSLLTFTAMELGADTLQAEVAIADTVLAHTWTFEVAENYPQAVDQIFSEPGFEAGSIELVWAGVDQLVDPILGYDIVVSDQGPITESNWEQAVSLGRIDHQGADIWHRASFTVEQHGFEAGHEVWLAIRSLDTREVLSSLETNLHTHLSEAWWIDGTMSDELGNPLAGVTVADEDQQWENTTDQDGVFRLGPYPDHRRISFRTHSPDEPTPDKHLVDPAGTAWHDYRLQDLGMNESEELDIRLLTRWGSDEECPGYEGSFLQYFRYITRTSVVTPLRPDHRLYHWESYPLKVFLPEHQAPDLDLREACLATMDIWNMIMGEDYFVVVADPGDADVEFLFEDMGPDANGQTSLLEPDDQDYHLGDVIPQRMRVRINDQQEDLQRIQETSLHELGHVLGLNRHLLCNQPGYLMYVTAAGVLDDGPENAIHIDEQRAVRAIRYLPQGYDLGGF